MPLRHTGYVRPLFTMPSQVPPIESTTPFIALAALAPETQLNEPRDGAYSFGSITSCDSEPMCSIEEAANASFTRAPILGKSTRFATIPYNFPVLFPVLRRTSSAPNMNKLSA